jgi:hypothetical protein
LRKMWDEKKDEWARVKELLMGSEKEEDEVF